MPTFLPFSSAGSVIAGCALGALAWGAALAGGAAPLGCEAAAGGALALLGSAAPLADLLAGAIAGEAQAATITASAAKLARSAERPRLLPHPTRLVALIVASPLSPSASPARSVAYCNSRPV